MDYINVREFIRAEVNPSIFHPSLWMPKFLRPDATIQSLESLEIELLKQNGIKGVLVDYDGVIGPYHSLAEPPKEKLQFLNYLSQDFSVAILSNRRGYLRDMLDETLIDYPIIQSEHLKPHKEAYQKAIDFLALPTDQIALIEDRLITGTAGGKRVGMLSIWVTPPFLDEAEPFNVRAYRFAEEGFLKLYDSWRAGK